MPLYLVCFDDDDGTNRDRFVSCESPKKAVELWQAGYHDDPDWDEACTETPKHIYEVSPLAHLDYGTLDWASDKIIKH